MGIILVIQVNSVDYIQGPSSSVIPTALITTCYPTVLVNIPGYLVLLRGLGQVLLFLARLDNLDHFQARERRLLVTLPKARIPFLDTYIS